MGHNQEPNVGGGRICETQATMTPYTPRLLGETPGVPLDQATGQDGQTRDDGDGLAPIAPRPLRERGQGREATHARDRKSVV